MKNIIPGILLSFLLFAITSISAANAQGVQVGIVEGLVSNPDNSAANNASVSVICNGVTLNTNTDSSGFYFVQFANGVCSVGMTATVNASKNSLSGSNTGNLSNQGAFAGLTLDVAIVHVPLVPEFGLVTGIFALTASAGSYFLIKRKKQI